MSSTFLIISMTFERFYSIVKPHKATSFNTVKKAKIKIGSIIVFSYLFNIPHLFMSDIQGLQCVPWGRGTDTAGQFYFYLQMTLAFILPFILLLFMNSVIIHTLRISLSLKISKTEIQTKDQGQTIKMKNSDMQIYVTLHSGTFAFLLTTPVYIVIMYMAQVEIGTTPRGYAEFYIYYQVGEKSYYTNYAINFFLYAISGKKFRTDLMTLIRCQEDNSTT